MNLAMQEFTSVSFSTREQHRDVRSARQERDTQDTNKLIAAISPRTPFSGIPSLRCLNTEVCAEDSVNADQALQVGNQILNGLYGWCTGLCIQGEESSDYYGTESWGFYWRWKDWHWPIAFISTSGHSWSQQWWAERGVPVRAVQLSPGPVWVATCYVRGR